jgi:pyruvate,water dikinase
MATTHLATAFVAPFDTLRMTDVEAVGGKNASLGEMISQLSESGVRVPGGFATTAHAFRTFLSAGGLASRIAARLAVLDVDDVRALAEAGADAFTVGSAVFDGRFGDGALREQLKAVLDACG